MTNKNNATCRICGKPYHLCASCKDFNILYPWKLHTDTAEHYKIYQIIHGYSTGIYNKSEAKERLENVDLSDLKTLRENIQAIINEIIKSDNDKTKTVQQEVENKNKIRLGKSKKMCK